MEKTFQEEKKYLEKTLLQFEEIIEDEELRLKALPRMYNNDPVLLASLLSQYNNKLETLKRCENKPYFARIDFTSNETGKEEECYISKVGVSDNDNNLVTVDWRAPIASVYYDSNIGGASYLAPEGLIKGTLNLKRQYDIENKILNSFQDVDTVSNDEILKPYLNASADNRLKNIVSTIQSEQNKIIRNPLYNNLIIQGVAGSGKTTVALHRVAYLVYNNRQNINANQYIVIGPNKFFINYISNVLPDLDVNNVSQLTYDEIVKNLINEDFNLISDKNKLLKLVINPDELFYQHLKVSLSFKDKLDEFIKDFDKMIVPDSDLIIKGYKIISNKVIKKIYDSLDYSIIAKKIEKASLLIGKDIFNHSDVIMNNIWNEFNEKTKMMDKDKIDKERNNIVFIEKELRNNCNQSLKKYFSKARPNILNLYLSFLEKIDNYGKEEIDITNKVKENITALKKKNVEFEDLASLVYLYYRIYGPNEYLKYRQVVIDEAQDFGEFNFLALKLLMPNATFSIFGDLAQSIYQYRGIESWEKVIKTTFDDKCDLMYLSKSYRTTTEIMNSANNITKHLNLVTADPVIRHGKNVNYVKFTNNQPLLIKDIINSYIEKGYNSIAVICKDEEEVIRISEELKKIKIDIKTITDLDIIYQGGICVITSYLAKGLEFDGVIISNASEDVYNSLKSFDMKLLYVAMTRPLHELNILYNNEITKPLLKEIH